MMTLGEWQKWEKQCGGPSTDREIQSLGQLIRDYEKFRGHDNKYAKEKFDIAMTIYERCGTYLSTHTKRDASGWTPAVAVLLVHSGDTIERLNFDWEAQEMTKLTGLAHAPMAK